MGGGGGKGGGEGGRRGGKREKEIKKEKKRSVPKPRNPEKTRKRKKPSVFTQAW